MNQPHPATPASRAVDALHRMLATDFCPGLNQYFYWMKNPLTALVAAILVSLICGILVNPLALMVSGLLMVLGVLGCVWPWLSASGLEGEVSFLSQRVRIGEAVVVRLRIHNRRRLPVWGLSLRRGIVRSDDPRAGVALAWIPGRSTVDVDWTFVPGERGVYPYEKPRLDTGFPFGLFHSEASIKVLTELVVWPQSVALDTLPDAVEIELREQRFTDRRVGDQGDLLGTRPYRPGDSLRRVHWGQTARHGRLIVTERQAPSSCAVSLTVDIAAQSHRTCGARCTLETTLSIAASMIETLHRNHAFIDCRIGAERFSIGESRRELHRALDALARVPRHGAECPAVREQPRSSNVRIASAFTVTGDFQAVMAGAFGREKVLLVADAARLDSQPAVLPASWLTLGPEEAIDECLPARWRNACLAG